MCSCREMGIFPRQQERVTVKGSSMVPMARRNCAKRETGKPEGAFVPKGKPKAQVFVVIHEPMPDPQGSDSQEPFFPPSLVWLKNADNDVRNHAVDQMRQSEKPTLKNIVAHFDRIRATEKAPAATS